MPETVMVFEKMIWLRSTFVCGVNAKASGAVSAAVLVDVVVYVTSRPPTAKVVTLVPLGVADA